MTSDKETCMEDQGYREYDALVPAKTRIDERGRAHLDKLNQGIYQIRTWRA